MMMMLLLMMMMMMMTIRCCGVSDVQTFIVVARDKMIFRFSAMKGFNLLSPFSPVRRAAIYVYSHPYPLSVTVAGAEDLVAGTGDLKGLKGLNPLSVVYLQCHH